ncbi:MULTISPECIES: helix-turn-helix transcriptional regulator [unclassified Streptomyces]|uniref:helix-turn-helix transcriptional regulator n=1 Tax=unclassified Streptomyces TaxID=2593676 RepID=UPI002E22FDF5|nr:helix-turn-helix transcriptional regulator [Streptomyces sp. NBC_01023]
MPARVFDGRRFRAVRRAADLTQAAIAQEVGVLEPAVTRWESGDTTPPPERLPRLAQIVGQPLDGLFPRVGLPDLVDLRTDAGYSQKDTSAITKTLSPSPVRKAEGGKRRLSKSLVPLLAEAYGTSTAELLAAQERSFGILVPQPPRLDDNVGEQSQMQIDVLSGLENAGIRKVALRAAGLSTVSLETVLSVLDEVRQEQGLPPIVGQDELGRDTGRADRNPMS